MDGKFILWVGLAVCFTYGFFWRDMFEDSYFILQAVSFFLLSLYLILKERGSFICYLWICYSFNNLIDELIGTPTAIGINEKLIIVATPTIWIIIKIWKNDRQSNRGSD